MLAGKPVSPARRVSGLFAGRQDGFASAGILALRLLEVRLGIVSVHTGDDVEEPSIQPLGTLEEAPSSPDRLDWRRRDRIVITLAVVLTLVVFTIVFSSEHLILLHA